MKQKQMANLVKLNHQLHHEKQKHITAIEQVIVGSSSFLLLTPVYFSNINETSLPIAILSLLEIGSIYLPIKGIHTILKTKKRMVLTKSEINHQKKNTDLQDIENAYQLVMQDIHNKTSNEKKGIKLKKIEKEIYKLYQQIR